MPRFSIVGQKHRNLDPYLPGIEAGCEALLVREPTNQHDPNAVAVWIDGTHVGYLRKEDNGPIAKRIDDEGAKGAKIAADQMPLLNPEPRAFMRATFRRSPNSAYPQVEID